MIECIGLTGITLVIVRGAVFDRFREWLLSVRPNDIGYLFTCCHCMGFWIGLFGGAIYADFFTAPLYAGAVSLLALMTDCVILVLTESRKIKGE